MLSPKRVKFRKMFKGRTTGHRDTRSHGGVRTVWIAGARAGLGDQPADRGGPRGAHASHQARRQGVDPHLPRQAGHEEAGGNANGKGKGSPESWVAVVKPGRIMFELEGIDRKTAEQRDGARGGEARSEVEVRCPRGGAHRCELKRFAS